MIGNMRRRVVLQRYTRTTDDAGGASVAFSDLATLWAAIEPVRARESDFADKQREVVTHKIKLRYRRDITNADRLKEVFTKDGTEITRFFAIKGIRNLDNRFEFIELDCEEGVPT